MSDFVIVFDCEQMRPACVLLQVAMGGTVPSRLFQELFDARAWLTFPTPTLLRYRLTEEQLHRLAAKVVAP